MGKFVPALVLILVIIYVATSPHQAATMASNIGGFLSRIAHGLGRFFNDLA